ncbi:Sec-independent protein translocase protein TatB [soil metagenome]|jgi:sec-independent protein translocase protein TatB
MFGEVGFWEIVALAVIALFVFGPERLPGMARNAGKTIAAIRREATKALDDMKNAAGLDDELMDVANDARELRTSLKDVRRSATAALIGPLDEVRGELSAAKADIESFGKGQSGPGMAELSPTAAGAVPGHAPFDPDAT